MKITKIEAIPFHIPFLPDLHLKFAYRTSTGADHVLVRIYTDDGIIGISEAPARPQIYGETQESIISVIDKYLGPSIQGKDPFQLDAIHSLLDRIPYNYCAKASIDIALHDLMGKYMNLPIYQFLGGKSQNSIPLSWMVGINSKEKMIDECKRFLNMGIKAFKIKAGLDFDDDLDNFIAIRTALDDGVILYLDANQGYKSTKKTIRLVKELVKYDLCWIEEPLPIVDKKGRLEVASAIPVPILGDESCFTPYEVAEELKLGAVGMVLIKVARTGFYNTRKIIYLCQQAGIPCLIGSQGDSSLGAVASSHIAVAFNNIMFPSEISYHLRMQGDLLIDPPKFKNGELIIADKPGLGVDVAEDALKRFRL